MRADLESHVSDARADSESHCSGDGHADTSVTVVTADTLVMLATHPARRRRPDIRKVSRFQHSFWNIYVNDI